MGAAALGRHWPGAGTARRQNGVPWDDASGATLMQWLGVTEGQFRDPDNFALLPMDFYYPGPGRSGSGEMRHHVEASQPSGIRRSSR